MPRGVPMAGMSSPWRSSEASGIVRMPRDTAPRRSSLEESGNRVDRCLDGSGCVGNYHAGYLACFFVVKFWIDLLESRYHNSFWLI